MMLGETLRDLRLGARSLFRRPSAAIAAAVAAMALGIGAAVAIFSVVNAVLLQPLPYPGADRVVAVWNRFAKLGFDHVGLSEAELVDYRARSASLQEIAGIDSGQRNLTGGGEPQRINLAAVSPSLFRILGIQPSRGRIFLAGEALPGAPRLAVLSDEFWRERRGADPRAIGRDVVLNGRRYTVIGVMPPNFRYPERTDVWVPLRMDPAHPDPDRGNHHLAALAQLKPGVALRTAQVEMSGIARQMVLDLPKDYPRDSGWGVSLTPFREELTGNVRPALLIVLVAVGLVLLMACANVANLQIERALGRSREIAVRTALGEPRARLVRRFIVESLMVAFVGGGAGVVAAAFAVRALTRIDPTAIPRAYDIALDASVLLFAVGLALVTGLVIGLVPAVESSKLSLTESLKEGGEKSVGGRRSQRVRRTLVVVETSMALVLVVGAGLLARTFANLQRVDPGYDPANTLTLQLALPDATYGSNPQIIAFYQRLVEGAAALPGVRHAGIINCLPLSGCDLSSSYYVEDHMPAAGVLPPEAELRFVSPDYFRAIGMTLEQGRFFTAQDGADAPKVVIVDEELARRTWPGQNPIGKHVKFTLNMANPWRPVVGVVGHVKNLALNSQSREQIYVPSPQFPLRGASLAVRSDSHPTALAGPLRDLVKRLDPELPVFDVQTMSDRLASSMAARQLSMSLVLSLALLALFLAAVGMYSVITNSVNQRRREIGMRMALGAQRRDILGMVVGEGVVTALVGILAGLALAHWATELLGSLLYGIATTDLATYLTTALLLVALAAAVSYFPARRATRTSPMNALGRD